MRTLNIAAMAIGIAFLALLGILALVGAVYPAVFLVLGDAIAGPLAYAIESLMGRTMALLVGLALLAGGIYFVLGNIKTSRRERTVVLQNPIGEVKVSLPAIEDFARVLKGRIEGLRDIKGRVIYGRRGLKVSARISVLSDYSIAEVSQKVQEGIRNYIQNILGIEQEINPTVIVTKVVNREKTGTGGAIKTTRENFESAGEETLK
ncbi:alkaline shock response membrane anchor protein AmaP [bacterium]|nr:alkaline shock response membrane anchor protein AmaP [bacterium]